MRLRLAVRSQAGALGSSVSSWRSARSLRLPSGGRRKAVQRWSRVRVDVEVVRYCTVTDKTGDYGSERPSSF